MKQLKSRIATVLMSMMLVFSMNTTVFAAENDAEPDDVAIRCDYELAENDDSSSEYFRFGNPNQRMDEKGNFTFSFSYALDSDLFKPASSSIKVYATATSSSSDQTYYISLYKAVNDTYVKGVTYKADGTTQFYEFTDLDTSSYYYLSASKPLFSTGTITGSGHIDYIQ